MSLKPASRIDRIEPFHVMDLLGKARAMAAEGREVIHLEVGEPDFPTPDAIVQGGIEAMTQGNTKYTPALGIPELKQRIAEFYWQSQKLEVNAKNIAVTPGASGALLLALSATLNAGDKLLLPEPGYPCNRHFAELLDIQPQVVNLRADENYQLNFKDLEEQLTPETKGILIASPGNPTGAVLSSGQQKQLVDFVSQHNLHLFMDEIYQGLIYEGHPNSILHESKNPWVIQSFSKYFQMTGWRLGWLVVPDDFIEAVDRLAQNLFLCAPAPAQYAALNAFDSDVIQLLEQRKSELNQRKNFLKPELEKLGFKINAKPEGAFYIYADASRFTNDAMGFCHELLDETGVAITPGQDFGGANWKTEVRFAYTCEIPVLERAITKLKDFLK